MTIDKSGKWWTGSEPDDLHEYLTALTASAHKIDEFRLSNCECGSLVFALDVDQDEGVARRKCEQCKREHFLCDSAEYYEGQRLKRYRCVTCKSRVVNVGVGYSLYEDKQGVRWLYVGNRCTGCGTLGSMVDWKVAYEPSQQLLDAA